MVYNLRVTVQYLCSIFVFGLNQQYSGIASVTEALVPSNTKEFALFDACLAEGVSTSIAHVLCCLFTDAANVPTWHVWHQDTGQVRLNYRF